jgi:hypothetical protein
MRDLLLSPPQGAHVRTVATEDEPLDRVGEAILAIAVRHEIRFSLHLRTGIAHGDAETAPLEHRDIIAAVADDGDFRQRNSQQLRDLRQCDTLVGERVGDVEVVGLRTDDGSAVSRARPAHCARTAREARNSLLTPTILAAASRAESEILDDCRPESHRAFLNGT